MKKHFAHIVVGILLCSGAVYAQEASIPKASETDQDDVYFFQFDQPANDSTETNTTAKTEAPQGAEPTHSPVLEAVEQETRRAQSAKNTDDPSSFNFLYYIIQKYKMSDLAD